jgi:IS4 transposase
VAQSSHTSVNVLLASLPSDKCVREHARRLGVVRRQGKIDIYAMLMTVVLGIAVRGPTALAQLGHLMSEVTGTRLARSSFWSRFTPAFTDLVQWLLDLLVQEARKEQPRPPGLLSVFRDVLAADATVVKLHEDLAGVWRGTRHNAKAALKVHAWVRVFTGELLKYTVTEEAFGDSRAFGVDKRLRGCLVLLDRAYSSPSLWRRIDSVGGYFLTPLPADRNPMITAELSCHRGRSRKVVNHKLREILPGLQRSILDVRARFKCKVRKYRTRTNRWVHEEFRLVAIRDRKTKKYLLFVTNAPPEMLPAEVVQATYKLRWEVETFFRTSKSGSGLTELPSTKSHIVLTLVFASLLRATTSMQALARFRRELVLPMGRRINPQQWLRWWNRQLHILLDELVGSMWALDDQTLAFMLSDPNVGRPTNRGWFRLPENQWM